MSTGNEERQIFTEEQHGGPNTIGPIGTALITLKSSFGDPDIIHDNEESVNNIKLEIISEENKEELKEIIDTERELFNENLDQLPIGIHEKKDSKIKKMTEFSVSSITEKSRGNFSFDGVF